MSDQCPYLMILDKNDQIQITEVDVAEENDTALFEIVTKNAAWALR